VGIAVSTLIETLIIVGRHLAILDLAAFEGILKLALSARPISVVLTDKDTD
jgi:hypothetical protein